MIEHSLDKESNMFTPTKARSALRFTLLAGAVLLGACTSEVTAPKPAQHVNEAKSMFAPSAAAKALIGIADGTYSVTIDPTINQQFNLGPNYLSLPANSVCNLLTSGYGASYWDAACTPETNKLTLTVIIRNATSANPSLDFSPAMRFNPATSVQLFIYAPKVNPADGKKWMMKYCPDGSNCFDESATDASLASNIDYTNNVLFRRVKHFSGYTVAERDSTTPPPI